MSYKLAEACREPGCPICRLEQQGVERYLDSQFYENVNSPTWRERLRASPGFCHEHAWLSVNKHLGDALGFSIIYHDVVNNLLRSLDKDANPGAPRRGTSLRDQIKRVVAILTPRKRCPVCEHREEIRRNILSALVEELPATEMRDALQASDGLCLPHWKQALGYVNEGSVYEILLTIQRTKLENLKGELAEFIRKNEYQAIKEGFGSEGDSWLRTIAIIAGSRKES